MIVYNFAKNYEYSFLINSNLINAYKMSQNNPNPHINSESPDELYKEAYRLLEKAHFLSDPKGSIRNKKADKYCSIIFAVLLIFSYPLLMTLAPAPFADLPHSRPPNTPVKVLRYTPPATSSQRVTPLHDPLAWTCDEEGLFYDEIDQSHQSNLSDGYETPIGKTPEERIRGIPSHEKVIKNLHSGNEHLGQGSGIPVKEKTKSSVKSHKKKEV